MNTNYQLPVLNLKYIIMM